jgi:hypothetical protein
MRLARHATRSRPRAFGQTGNVDGRTAPPLPVALARRPDARRLRRPGRQRAALAYLYSRDNEAEARQAKVLTKDEVRRIAINVARLPELLGKADRG